MEKDCLFCRILEEKEREIIYDNKSFYTVLDKFPVNPGHALIIAKRHIASLFDLSREDFSDLFAALSKTKELIKEKYHPDGYNIGVNEGEAAGRTIDHLHIQFIPRYKGDVLNPRGGIRNVIPGKGDYTKKENSEANIKEDIENILKKELKVLFDIEKYPSVLNYVTRKIFGTIENYMTSNEARESFKICLYTKRPEKNPLIKPGDIFEVIAIEPFTKGEVVVGYRFDLMEKEKCQKKKKK